MHRDANLEIRDKMNENATYLHTDKRCLSSSGSQPKVKI